MLYGRKSISLIIHSEAPSHWQRTKKSEKNCSHTEAERKWRWRRNRKILQLEFHISISFVWHLVHVAARAKAKVMETRTKWGQLDVLISEMKKIAVQLTDSKFMSLFHLSLYWNEELFSNAHKSCLVATLRKKNTFEAVLVSSLFSIPN